MHTYIRLDECKSKSKALGDQGMLTLLVVLNGAELYQGGLNPVQQYGHGIAIYLLLLFCFILMQVGYTSNANNATHLVVLFFHSHYMQQSRTGCDASVVLS